SLSAPCRTAIPIERVVKQYGKPQEEGKESIDTGSSRETCTVYWYGPVGIGFGEDKLVSSVFCRDRPEGFWGKLTLDEIVFPSLACVLPTQALIEGKRNLPQSSKGPSSDTQTHSNNLSSKKISSLPDYQEELSGANEVRVLNPNPFAVSAGIRSGKAGKDFEVPPHAARSVFIPDGLFDFYVVYSNRPDSLYQGDAFSLRGNGVEIQLVHVVGGNYGMRKVK
ncbi:MAG: hypothetical protein NTX87_19150, partial [Planctomycetota bacterium]|nr:hypothetical protein [Planctomycetota bacterium]